MAKLSSLIVDLQVNSAAMRQGLDKANSKLSGFAKQAQAIGSLIAASFAFKIGKDLVVGLASFVKGGAEVADTMIKLSRTIGVPVDQLSKLSYAAGFAGVSTEELGKGLQKMNKNLGDATRGLQANIDIFAGAGIKIHDTNGRLKSSDVIMGEVADKFASMADGAAKSALAQDLFGKSGARMISMLNGGKAGLEAAAKEAEAFGMVINTVQGEQAERFNDSLDRIGKVSDGLALKLSAELAPAVIGLAEAFTNAAKEGDAVSALATAMTAPFKGLAGIIVILVGKLKTVWALVEGLTEAFQKLEFGNTGESEKALDRLATKLLVIQDETTASLEKIFADAASGAGKAVDGLATGEELFGKGGKGPTVTVEFMFEDAYLVDAERLASDRRLAAETEVASFKRITDDLDTMFRSNLGAWQKLTGTTGTLIKGTQFELASMGGGAFGAGRMGGATAAKATGPTPASRAMEQVARDLKAVGATLAGIAAGIGGALAVAGNRIVSSLGDFGGLVGDAFAGFEQAGIGGAIAAVLSTLFTMSEAFKGLVLLADGIVTATLTQLQPAMELLATALGPVLGAIGMVIASALQAIAPVWSIIGQVLELITPFLVLVAMLLDGLAPVIKILVDVLSAIISALKPIIQVLFSVAQAVIIVILGFVKGVLDIWNFIIQKLAEIISTAVAILTLGFVTNAGDFLLALKVPTTDIGTAMDNLGKVTWDSASATAAESAARFKNIGKMKKLDDQMAKLNDTLTNVPRGFRVQAARYAAQGQTGVLGASTAGALPMDFNVYLDGNQLEATVTRRQESNRTVSTGNFGRKGFGGRK